MPSSVCSEEELKREQALGQEKQIHATTLQTFQSRETSLEADNVEYINALAAAQRAIEEKSAALQRLLAEKRWIEADQQVTLPSTAWSVRGARLLTLLRRWPQALQDQLAASKSRLDVEHKQAATLQAALRSQLNTVNNRVDELQAQLNDARNAVLLPWLAC